MATRRYELPFASDVPRLHAPDLGFVSIREHAGGRCKTQITLLDAPDYRMLRAGIQLAHRVADGEGDWCLFATGWDPFLPAEQSVPFDDSDLPEILGAQIRPFRRSAPIGPVAACDCERSTYSLLGEGGTLLATIQDELVTLQSGGLIVTRYREIVIETTEDLTSRQSNWIAQQLESVGGVEVAEFPSLPQRLGAPASGGTDLPPSQGWSKSSTIGDFTTALFKERVLGLTLAELSYRAGESEKPVEVDAHLAKLRRELFGLDFLLDESWIGDVVADIDWSLQPTTIPFGDRYYAVLDALILGSRSPRLQVASEEGAWELFVDRLNLEVNALTASCAELEVESPLADWEHARQQADHAFAVAKMAALLRKRGRKLASRLKKLTTRLSAAAVEPIVFEHSEIDRMTPAAAFAAGVGAQKKRRDSRMAREKFVAKWLQHRERLTKELAQL